MIDKRDVKRFGFIPILAPFWKFRVRRRIGSILLFLVAAIAIASCGGSVGQVRNLEAGRGEQIIILGDSIASGYGVASEQAFPAVLSRRLNVPVLNRGVAGDTTAMGLKRLERDVLDENPWLVMVELGGNDYLRQIPKTQAEENLRTIITRIQDNGAIAVILGVYADRIGGDYKRMFERLAKETRSYLIPDLLKGVIDNPKRRQDDVIHPNAAGHEFIGDRVYQDLQPLLKRATIPESLRAIELAN